MIVEGVRSSSLRKDLSYSTECACRSREHDTVFSCKESLSHKSIVHHKRVHLKGVEIHGVIRTNVCWLYLQSVALHREQNRFTVRSYIADRNRTIGIGKRLKKSRTEIVASHGIPCAPCRLAVVRVNNLIDSRFFLRALLLNKHYSEVFSRRDAKDFRREVRSDYFRLPCLRVSNFQHRFP